MKKTLFLVILMVAVALPAFATDSADGKLSLGTANGSYDIALSPNVTAVYDVGPNATGGAQQWWVAGTTHSGGNDTFGTASDITKIYKKANDDGNRLDELPTNAQSEEVWSDNEWEL